MLNTGINVILLNLEKESRKIRKSSAESLNFAVKKAATDLKKLTLKQSKLTSEGVVHFKKKSRFKVLKADRNNLQAQRRKIVGLNISDLQNARQDDFGARASNRYRRLNIKSGFKVRKSKKSGLNNLFFIRKTSKRLPITKITFIVEPSIKEYEAAHGKAADYFNSRMLKLFKK